MTTERIDIITREDGSRVVSRNLKDLGNTAEDVAGSFGILEKAIVGFLAAFSFQKFAAITGVWTDLNARVQRFAGSVEGTSVIMDRLLSIAQRTYAPLESISEIYLENAFALEQLGKSTNETLDYTEALTNALVVSGAKGQRQASVISAMSKAMLEGKLAGDNWNTVLTTGGRVVEALVQETGKSLTELKEMAKAGQLTSDTVFTALLSQLEQLREEADEMPATIGDAFIRLQNQAVKSIGSLDEELGLSSAIVQGIDWITQHLDQLIPIVAGLGVTIAITFAPNVIMQFVGALRALFTLMALNPFTALVAAIAGVLTYLYMMRDEIKLGIDDVTTLGDMLAAAWEAVGPVLEATGDMLAQFFGWLTDTSAGTFTEMLDQLNGYEHQNEAIWLKILRVVVKIFDMIGGVVRASMMAVWTYISTTIDESVNAFRALGEVASAALSFDIDGTKAAIANYATVWKQGFSNIAEASSKAFRDEILSQDSNGLESVLNKWIARSQELAAERIANQSQFAGFSAGSGGGSGGGGDPKKLKALADALDALLNKINPIRAAEQELAKAEKTLNDAVAAGLITRIKANEAYGKLKEQLREQLQPYEFMIEKMQEEAELSKYLGEQRRIEIALRDRVNQLTKAGVTVTEEMTAALRAQLVVQQQLDKIGQEKETLMAQSAAGQLAALKLTAQAMRDLLDDAKSNFTSGDVATIISQQFGDLLAGTSIATQANAAAWKLMYDQINEYADAHLISETQRAEALAALDRRLQEQRLGSYADMFGQLSQLAYSENKEMVRIGKAAAIAQATINGYLAVTKAWAEVPYPANIAAAAIAAVTAASQVASIISTPIAFRTGGSMTVGGSGGTDSQLVAFRATPGEKVTVNTPAQARAAEQGGGGDVTVNSPISVAVVGTREAAMSALKSSEGRAFILEVIEEERGTVARAIGVK